MSKENNVAAPADHSKPRERSPYVLGVKPSTWDAQIAAQAGDEPIRAAMNVASQCRATAFHPISFQIEVDGGNGLLHELLVDAACAIEALAAQVSPHATADVEQLTNAQIREIMHKSSRYMGQPGYYSDTEFDCLQDVISFARAIEDEAVQRATTKPGA